jgi:hypothetical protein
MATILNFFNPPKAATHYGGYSYKVSWSLMKGIQKCFKSPFFVSMATAATFVQPIPICMVYVRSISRRCFDQTLWNLLGISYAMWSCIFKGWFFSKWLSLPWKRLLTEKRKKKENKNNNKKRSKHNMSPKLGLGDIINYEHVLTLLLYCSCFYCHSYMLKKMKNTKMIIAGYSPNRNWWNLIGTTSTSSGTLLTEERNKERRRIIIRNGSNTICIPNFVWET